MKKEFVFSARFDTSDFDKSINEIQQKLKAAMAPSNMAQMQQQTSARLGQAGMGGIMSAPSMEAFQRATQASRREMDALITSQAQGQEKLGKIIAQRSEMLKKLQTQQKQLVKDSEEELKVKEKIARVEANSQQLRENYKQRDANLNQLLDAKQSMRPQGIDRLMNAYNGGGVGGAATAAGRMAMQNPIGAMGLAGGALGAVGAFGSSLANVTGYGQRLQEARGSAIEGTAGQNLRDIYSGRSPFEGAFSAERNAAAGLAAQKAGRNRFTDRLTGIGGIGGGILGGAAAGAAIGSVVPVIGTAIGGVAGGVAGGVGSYLNSSDRTRASINPFAQKEYGQLLARDQTADFRSNYESLKNQDPGKKLAIEGFEQNRLRDVGAQRQLGLSDSGYYKGGGFLSNVQQGGFMAEQGIGMANSIIGAGGSARMGGQAQFGLQMERAGLTNAGSILGATSGSMQNSGSSKQATISIMSEAFKIGLDNTQFAEENRRFSQAAANILGKTGATSEADQDRLSQVLGQFMGQKTNAGVNEAQGAYEKYQERGSQTTGRRGALRFQSAMKDKDLSKMDTSDLTELLSMRPEEMNASNPAMAEFAKSAGISVDDLVQKMTGKGGVNEAGRFLFPGQKNKIGAASKTVEDYMKKTGMTYSDVGDKSRIPGALPPEVQQAMGRMGIEANKSEGGGLTAGSSIATAGEFVSGNPVPGDMKGRAQQELSGTGRLSDVFTKEAAEGADEARKNFNQMTDALWNLSAAAKAFVTDNAGAAGAGRTAASANNRSLPQGYGNNSDVIGTLIPNYSQPQANKPKGK